MLKKLCDIKNALQGRHNKLFQFAQQNKVYMIRINKQNVSYKWEDVLKCLVFPDSNACKK